MIPAFMVISGALLAVVSAVVYTVAPTVEVQRLAAASTLCGLAEIMLALFIVRRVR